MPRGPRIKSSDSIYHVMCRSISETNLFRCDEDKSYYLHKLKFYLEKYHCKLYAYVLMDTHVHLYIDPCGFDISVYMLPFNTAYALYYNRKYHRHGPLFQGRFTSVIVKNDTYSLTLSAYIHNNAKDIPGYSGREEFYRYSSYGIYTGTRKDIDNLVDTSFILSQFSTDIKTAKEKYKAFTEALKDTGIVKKVDDNIMEKFTENIYISGKKHIIREGIPEVLIQRIVELLKESHPEDLRAKYSRQANEYRAFITYVMRVLCGYTYKRICEYIGNMSISGVSRLTTAGFRLLDISSRYRDAFNLLIQTA